MLFTLSIASMFIFIAAISAGCFINACYSDLKRDTEMRAIATFTGITTIVFLSAAAALIYKVFF